MYSWPRSPVLGLPDFALLPRLAFTLCPCGRRYRQIVHGGLEQRPRRQRCKGQQRSRIAIPGRVPFRVVLIGAVMEHPNSTGRLPIASPVSFVMGNLRVGKAIDRLAPDRQPTAPVGIDPVAEIALVPRTDFVEQLSPKEHARAAHLTNLKG